MRSYKPKQRTANIVSVPAPTGGINDTDNISTMDPIYALDMLNLFPNDRALKVRNGYREWVTGLGDNARTLMSYNDFAGTDELFAATDSGIFDVSSSGVAGVAVSALTNGELSWVNFANIAGQYLVAVNGVDAGKLYDGTTWIDFTTVGAPVNPGEVSGADMDDMDFVHAHKKRLWFVKRDSMTAYYLPTDAVSGAMTAFELGGVFLRGGALKNIFTWSMDSGDGLNDILIFQSSKGELAGYSGTDPSTAATFLLESVYFVGSPLGRRTNQDLGGDVAVLTVNGIVPVSKIVGGTQAIANSEQALTRNISRTFNQFVRDRAFSPNWEMINVPSLTMMLVNFPDQNGVGAVQFVMNTLSGAWTKFDLPVVTMVEHREALYFSDGNGRVMLYDITVNLDNISLSGEFGDYIDSNVVCAYSYFGMMSKKAFTLVRPLFLSTVYPSMAIGIGTDFRPSLLGDLTDPTGGPSTADLWDSATWDITSWFLPNVPTASDVWDSGIWDETLWSPPMDTQYEWIGVAGIGYTASVAMKLRTSVETEFVTVDWTFNPSLSL
jgi:hypothetical protein